MKRFALLIVIGALLHPSWARAVDGHSVARLWNEEALASIRGDLARPTVHARNLFHVSLAMWDAWAVYDDVAAAILSRERITASDIPAAREEAISFATYRVLRERFAGSPSATSLLSSYDDLMEELGYDLSITTTEGNSPAAVGNRIAERVLAFGLTDGSNESEGFANRFYEPINPPLLPALPGNPDLVDRNRWQPLALDFFVDQAGNPIVGGYPDFLSPEWGGVTPFSLSPADRTNHSRGGWSWPVWHDPGPPPLLGTATEEDFKRNFELVVAWSKHLDPSDGVLWDISPRSIGAAVFPASPDEWETFYDFENGGDTSAGYVVNPVTGEPYTEQLVPRGDYARVLAEFWADGPDSETPPGHWFVILNYVSDNELLEKRIGGEGEIVSDLEWDVKAYVALGGAMHDAAIAAWSVKGWYDFIRPISVIRDLSDRGQSSDPGQLSYNPEGIRLYPEIIEVITFETTRPRRKHRHLRGNEGKIAINAWRGHDEIRNPLRDTADVGWILAREWWPYQRSSFVTPFFAGFVSGHSTFSRTAAVILHRLTGSPYFPGGLGEFFAPRNEFLVFEDGPSVDVTLQWASYYDAADQCSLSRIWGGIHPPADDLPGRTIGDAIGPAAWARANQYWAGELQVLDIGLDSLPKAEEDVAYEVDLQILGGTPPYDCRVVEGDLPDGLTLADDGRIHGIPERRYRASALTVMAEDALGVATQETFTIEVVKALRVGARRFRRGREGKKYRMRLRPRHGEPPYEFRVADGSLPDGLAIDDESYRIEGTPLESGSFPLTLEVTDRLGALRRIQGEMRILPPKGG